MEAAGRRSWLPELLLLLLLELVRRRNLELEDFLTEEVFDVKDDDDVVLLLLLSSPAASLDNVCRMLLLLPEGKYLDGFKMLDIDSFVDGHLWRGRHFLRRRTPAALLVASPDVGVGDAVSEEDDDVSVLASCPAGEGGCLRVIVAESRNSSAAARPLRRGGLRC